MTDEPRSPNVVLVLTTHAHSPPLQPAPRLKYDLRNVPNPPKAIRDTHTGVSKRLRDHMLEHDLFVELLKRSEAEIHATVESMTELWKKSKEPVDRATRDRALQTGVALENEQEEQEDSDAEEDQEDDDTTEDVAEQLDQLVLNVGIFCARGQHRSVACAEELSIVGWPKDWEIVVHHRDLGRKRGDVKNYSGRYREIRGADMFRDK